MRTRARSLGCWLHRLVECLFRSAAGPQGGVYRSPIREGRIRDPTPVQHSRRGSLSRANYSRRRLDVIDATKRLGGSQYLTCPAMRSSPRSYSRQWRRSTKTGLSNQERSLPIQIPSNDLLTLFEPHLSHARRDRSNYIEVSQSTSSSGSFVSPTADYRRALG